MVYKLICNSMHALWLNRDHVQALDHQMRSDLFADSSLCMQHPGFDFSSAEISGEAPNPRTFLGGYSEK